MSAFDNLRKTMNRKALVATTAAGLGDVTKLPNEPFTPPTNAVYVDFWFKSGGGRAAEGGGGGKGLQMNVGIWQFTIYTPENQGDGPATQKADILYKYFNAKEWITGPYDYVKLFGGNVVTPFDGARDGHYIAICDGTYQFYHRDMDPLPFNA